MNRPANAVEIGGVLDQEVQSGGERCTTVDPGLLRAFLKHHRELVRFLSRRLRCLITARDLTQEVYLRLSHADGSNAIANPRALLFQIAANLATDHVRVEGRRTELLREAHDLLWEQADEISPERQALARDQLAGIEAALLQLPERTRHIFYLNRFEGIAQSEIAQQMGISRTNVEKHVRRAWTRIAEVLRTSDSDQADEPAKQDAPSVHHEARRNRSSLAAASNASLVRLSEKVARK